MLVRLCLPNEPPCSVQQQPQHHTLNADTSSLQSDFDSDEVTPRGFFFPFKNQHKQHTDTVSVFPSSVDGVKSLFKTARTDADRSESIVQGGGAARIQACTEKTNFSPGRQKGPQAHRSRPQRGSTVRRSGPSEPRPSASTSE